MKKMNITFGLLISLIAFFQAWQGFAKKEWLYGVIFLLTGVLLAAIHLFEWKELLKGRKRG